MSPKSFLLTPELHHYLLAHTTPIDEVQRSLIDETAALGGISVMQIAPEQGAFMSLLASAIGARRIIEVGTFTGYSALCLARALPADGTLLCCDISEEWTDIARRHWTLAGIDDRIDLRIAPASQTLAALAPDPHWDMAFLDADKANYIDYYEAILPRLRPGGLLLADNVLWSGAVLDHSTADSDTEAIRAFNDHVVADPRVECVMLPIADGLTVACKRQL